MGGTAEQQKEKQQRESSEASKEGSLGIGQQDSRLESVAEGNEECVESPQEAGRGEKVRKGLGFCKFVVHKLGWSQWLRAMRNVWRAHKKRGVL